MKSEKVNKKLELKKQEIANLSLTSMESARGGINDIPNSMRISDCTCPTGTAPGVCC
jgi:hypothetical protein